MKLANAIKKLSQYGEVQKNSTGKYWVIIGEYEVSFRRNGFGEDPSITCEHTRKLTDKDDSQSDYFAGSYRDNLTQAIKFATK